MDSVYAGSAGAISGFGGEIWGTVILNLGRPPILLKTSPRQVDRLGPTSDITLASLQRAAVMVGWRVLVELV